MTEPRVWFARLRPEYRWPYPALDPDRWYGVREHRGALDEPGWVWLDADPYAVHVFAEHLEPLALAIPSPESATDAEVRVARVVARARPPIPGVPVGAWIRARDVADVLSGSIAREGGRRRLRRLPDHLFEFRTEVVARS